MALNYITSIATGQSIFVEDTTSGAPTATAARGSIAIVNVAGATNVYLNTSAGVTGNTWTPIGSKSPGAGKYAKFLSVPIGTDIVPATTIGGAAFTNKLTIPAGTVATGDLLSLAFLVNLDAVAAAAPSNYTVGVRIGGAVGNVFSGTLNNGAAYPVSLGIGGGTVGGFQVGGATATIGLLGLFDDNTTYSTGIAAAGPFNAANAFDIEVWFNWQAGADPAAFASLLVLQAQITQASP